MGSSHSSSSPLPKRNIAEYYHLQKVVLGSGSFGNVRRGVNSKTNEYVAVKQIDKRRLDANPRMYEHLRREIEILGSCSHRNIVKLLDWFEDESTVSLVLEYCTGGDFGDKLAQMSSSITEKQACEWMYQILLAVDHLHAKRICHRDIKPENFLVDESGILKLSDFGLAIRVADASRNTLREKAGTPAFQAPEIHTLPDGKLSPKSSSAGYGLSVDLWACGVTLFVILSGGKNPFVSSDNKLMPTAIRSGTVAFGDLIVVTTAQVDQSVSRSNSSRFFQIGRKNTNETSPSGRRTRPDPRSHAEELLRALLTVDVTRRITVKEALNHAWFVQFGLASAPPTEAPKLVDSKQNSSRFSFDSLEPSPPAMELLLENPHGAQSPLSNNGGRSTSFTNGDMFELHMAEAVNTKTIGPRGEGKVSRCEQCGSFFYSQKRNAKCPDCRVQIGFAIPDDGVRVGSNVYFPGTGNTRWIGGKITGFDQSTGELVLEDGVKVAGASVAPPGKDTGPGPAWPKGTNVMYLSSSYGTWLPAFIEGFDPVSRSYALDVKSAVSADKIRARIKRISAQDK
jgi:serine/threonine protein kinase